MQSDGNGLTDRHVFSYWKGDDGELNSEVAEFGDISDIKVDGKADKYKTIVTVFRKNGSKFRLFVAKADNKDALFIRTLRKKIRE